MIVILRFCEPISAQAFACIYLCFPRWDEAVSDFDSALRLEKCIPSAHVNIGLIVITKYENYAR